MLITSFNKQLDIPVSFYTDLVAAVFVVIDLFVIGYG